MTSNRYTVECFRCRNFAAVTGITAEDEHSPDVQWHRVTMACGCTFTVQSYVASALRLLSSGTVAAAGFAHPDTDGTCTLRRGEAITT